MCKKGNFHPVRWVLRVFQPLVWRNFWNSTNSEILHSSIYSKKKLFLFSAPEGSSYHEPCLEHWVMTCLKHDTIDNSKLYETWKHQIRTMVDSFPCLKMVKLTIKTGVLRPDLVDIWQPLTCLKNLQELWVHSSRLVKEWVVNSRTLFFKSCILSP